MAKRNKPADPKSEPDLFEQFGKQLAKGGGIDRLLIFGEMVAGEIDIDPRVQKWLAAIDDAEQGDKAALVALLKAGSLPDVIVPHVGDLIERCYVFKKPKHRPRTPSHRLTDKEINKRRS
jgi:hypothetical protein